MNELTDKKLLALAAKAAGYAVRWHESWQCFVHEGPHNITNPPSLAGQPPAAPSFVLLLKPERLYHDQ